MDRKTIAAIVDRAIQRLITEECDLLERDVSERTIAGHLARFIREDVPAPYRVDTEYNRHIDDPKTLDLPPRDQPDEEPQETLVSPDLIVHVRGTDEHNLLVIEVKKPGRDLARDEQKLRAFRDELRYEHAAHIILGRTGNKLVHAVQWIEPGENTRRRASS